MKMGTKKFKIITFIGIILTTVFLVYAATYYKVNSGATTTVDEHGTCKEVTNNNAKAIFVPTNTDAEWTDFRNNAPGISLGSCCISQNSYSCYSDEIYWFDSCGNPESVKEYCSDYCENSICKTCPSPGSYDSYYNTCVTSGEKTCPGDGHYDNYYAKCVDSPSDCPCSGEYSCYEVLSDFVCLADSTGYECPTGYYYDSVEGVCFMS